MGNLVEIFQTAGYRPERVGFIRDVLSRIGISEYDEIRSVQEEKLPSITELPLPVQSFLKELEGLSPPEKIELIHTFSLNYIQYDWEEMIQKLSGGDGSLRPFHEITRDPVDVCGGYAVFESALLRYAGFEDEHIALMIVYAKHDNQENVGHAVTVVKLQEELYVLDSFLKNVSSLGNDMVARGQSEFSGKPISITYNPVALATFGTDNAYYEFARPQTVQESPTLKTKSILESSNFGH